MIRPDVVEPSWIEAGGEPSNRIGRVGFDGERQSHDVSTLTTNGVGQGLSVSRLRHDGWQPGAKTSTMTMRAPQQGHGRG